MKAIHWWLAVAGVGLLAAAGGVLGSIRAGCLLAGLAAIALGLWRRGERTRVVCRLKGLTWDRASFCRGWFITGSTGSGKTTSGIRQLLFQMFTNERNFGGLCIDEKGTLHEMLVEMAAQFGRAEDVIVIRVRSDDTKDDWTPPHRFNLIGHSSIPATAYARFVIDTATALGNRREQSFFKTAAQIHIAQAQSALAALDYEVTLENVYHLLTDVDEMPEVVTALETRRPELARHFQKFLAQPPEQLSGITGTVTNYLHYFTKPEIVEVFCRDSTFSLEDMDRGKIICLALPQKLQAERRYVSTFLKLLFYSHALQRFDVPEAERRQRNLLLFLADECQHFLTLSPDGISDHNVVDVLREAGVAFIAATQSSTSLIPTLGLDQANVLLLNLRNRLIFSAADEACARNSAEFLGKKFVYEYSETSGDGRRSRTRHRKETYRIEPHKLRALRNHECVLVHAEKGFRRRVLPPIETDGSVCRWFRQI